MALETATIRCDRCGRRETFLNVDKVGINWAQGMVQIQGAVARQIPLNLCDGCATADPFFPNLNETVTPATEADLKVLTNGTRK